MYFFPAQKKPLQTFILVECTEATGKLTSSIVHRNWISSDGTLCWPKFKGEREYRSLLKSGVYPSSNWKKYHIEKYKILYSTDDFEKAEVKLKEADNDSDILTCSEAENLNKEQFSAIEHQRTPTKRTPIKRKITKNKKYEDSISYHGSDDEDEDNFLNVPKKFPDPPLLNFAIDDALESTTVTSSQYSDTGVLKDAIKEVITSALLPFCERFARLEEKFDSHCASFSLTHPSTSSTGSEIRSPTTPVSSGIDFPLPLTSVEKLNEFEDFIENNRDIVATFFLRCGGRTPEKHIKRLLRSTFTDELARQFNWTGKKGSGKKALKDLQIIQVIIGE